MHLSMYSSQWLPVGLLSIQSCPWHHPRVETPHLEWGGSRNALREPNHLTSCRLTTSGAESLAAPAVCVGHNSASRSSFDPRSPWEEHLGSGCWRLEPIDSALDMQSCIPRTSWPCSSPNIRAFPWSDLSAQRGSPSLWPHNSWTNCQAPKWSTETWPPGGRPKLPRRGAWRVRPWPNQSPPRSPRRRQGNGWRKECQRDIRKGHPALEGCSHCGWGAIPRFGKHNTSTEFLSSEGPHPTGWSHELQQAKWAQLCWKSAWHMEKLWEADKSKSLCPGLSQNWGRHISQLHLAEVFSASERWRQPTQASHHLATALNFKVQMAKTYRCSEMPGGRWWKQESPNNVHQFSYLVAVKLHRQADANIMILFLSWGRRLNLRSPQLFPVPSREIGLTCSCELGTPPIQHRTRCLKQTPNKPTPKHTQKPNPF